MVSMAERTAFRVYKTEPLETAKKKNRYPMWLKITNVITGKIRHKKVKNELEFDNAHSDPYDLIEYNTNKKSQK